jgi:adenylate cyclase
MTSKTKRKLLQGMAIGLLSGLFAILVWLTGCLDTFELNTWDRRVRRMSKPGPATDKIVLVLIDQNSLDWASTNMSWTWPWAHEVYTEIIEYCNKGGARAIVMDTLFLDPSRFGVSDDVALGHAIRQSSNTVSAMTLNKESGATASWPVFFPDTHITIPSIESLLARPGFSNRFVFPSASIPIPEIASNSAAIGDVMLNPDDDGAYRRVSLFRIFDNRIVPSLALAGLAAGEKSVRIKTSGKDYIINERRIALDRNGYALLNFRGPSQTHRTVSAAQIFASIDQIRRGEKPQVDPAIFKDRFVVLGCTAFGLLDLRQSARSAVYPGVEVHATALDNLLSGDFFKEQPQLVTVVASICLGLFSALLLIFAANAWRSIISMAICLIIPVAAAVGAYKSGVNMPLLVCLLSSTLGSLGAIIVNYAYEGRQRRFIKKAFQQYLSPVVINQIIEDPSRLELGGQTKNLTIMFSDIRDFTGISEKLGPKNTTSLLNEYLSEMTAIIHEENGTIDKYIGDCIVAFWNAPIDQPDHAQLAVRACLRCQARLSGLRPRMKDRFNVEIAARTGMATGSAFIGNMGSRQRFDYSFIGDTGNLASRIEGVNKVFGTWLLIDEETRKQLAGSFPAREIALVHVIGRNEPVRLYEPMTIDEYQRKEGVITAFSNGLKLFYAGNFAEALKSFQSNGEADPPSAAYAKRCTDLIEAPPTSWTGIWQMTSK